MPKYEDWAVATIPDDTILIPGVIDSTDNLVEHARLIARRLKQFTGIIGKHWVIAGPDCGFSTVACMIRDYPPVTRARFEAMAEGARIASRELGGRG